MTLSATRPSRKTTIEEASPITSQTMRPTSSPVPPNARSRSSEIRIARSAIDTEAMRLAMGRRRRTADLTCLEVDFTSAPWLRPPSRPAHSFAASRSRIRVPLARGSTIPHEQGVVSHPFSFADRRLPQARAVRRLYHNRTPGIDRAPHASKTLAERLTIVSALYSVSLSFSSRTSSLFQKRCCTHVSLARRKSTGTASRVNKRRSAVTPDLAASRLSANAGTKACPAPRTWTTATA